MILLTGCWDRIELEEQAYIIVIGLDKAKGDNVSVTYEIENPQGGGGNITGMSEKEPTSEVVTVIAPDIISSKNMISSSITRRPTFSHTRTLVVSEELARSDDFFPLLESAIREREIQRDIFFIVSKENARDFIINNDPQLITRPHKFYDFIAKRGEETGSLSKSTIHKFLQLTEGDAGVFLAIYGTTKKSPPPAYGCEDKYVAGQLPIKNDNFIQMMGSAAFKEGKMIGLMTGEETRISHFLRPAFKNNSMLATYPDPLDDNRKITCLVKRSHEPNIKMDLNTDIPKIDITVSFEIRLIAIPSMINYVTNIKNRELLKKSIEKNLRHKFNKFIERTQYDFKMEPFAWSLEARKHFSTTKEYIDYDWMKSYPKAEVNLSIDVTITDFGKQLRPPDLESIKD